MKHSLTPQNATSTLNVTNINKQLINIQAHLPPGPISGKSSMLLDPPEDTP